MHHLRSKKIDRELALEILNWKYEKPYELYNNEVNEESLYELLANPYTAVIGENEYLTGFYCYGESSQVPAGRPAGVYKLAAIDIGIGMNPEVTGKGNGKLFFSFVLSELQKLFPDKNMRLTVAVFNERAIKLYENTGFIKEGEFQSSATAFITMVKN
ncbi:GNAT family N-acetyltransferase [Heyndrickxia sp. MSNUG]|uniref:GNAT family N-acetyltransferase n=1 Tax=Heyndrickxia sp. MSNUG TaxID=3136677 RepID=UPI003C30E423